LLYIKKELKKFKFKLNNGSLIQLNWQIPKQYKISKREPNSFKKAFVVTKAVWIGIWKFIKEFDHNTLNLWWHEFVGKFLENTSKKEDGWIL